MLRIQVRATAAKVDRPRFTKEMQTYVTTHMKRGMKAFVVAAIAKIPVRTGFAAGSLGALAQVAGHSYVIRPQGLFRRPTRFRVGATRTRPRFREREFKKKEYYHPPSGGRILKTPLSGRKFASQPRGILKVTETKATFDFHVNISYFNLSDISKSRSPRSPWKSFEAGTLAFKNYIETTATKRFPKLADFISRINLTTTA